MFVFRLKAIAKTLPEVAPNVISLRNFTSDFLLAQELSVWGCFSLISKQCFIYLACPDSKLDFQHYETVVKVTLCGK